MAYKIALFDMDGTILDTIGDLTSSLDAALAHTGHQHDFTTADVRSFFGSGATVATTRALAAEAGVCAQDRVAIGQEVQAADLGIDPAEVARVEAAFARIYAEHSSDTTRPYPGIPQMLEHLVQNNIHVAVISNKMDSEVVRLAELYFPGRFASAQGVREGIRRKPAPDTVQAVLAAHGLRPEEAVYIGDSEIDILTAHAAQTADIAVTWGFRDETFLRAHGATRIAHTAAELESLIVS